MHVRLLRIVSLREEYGMVSEIECINREILQSLYAKSEEGIRFSVDRTATSTKPNCFPKLPQTLFFLAL